MIFWKRRRKRLDPEDQEKLERLDQILAAEFYNFPLFKQSLRHRSYVHENASLNLEDNERLELLGDAVLDLVVTHTLLEEFPEQSEGDVSKIRSSLVSEKSLSDLALQFQLGEFLYLGKGEKLSGGAQKASLLANAYEAILGALFLDRGFEQASLMVRNHFKKAIASIKAGEVSSDYKTRLQELVQTRFGETPQYVLVAQSGPDHRKTFEIALKMRKSIYGTGKGKSKKEAEQEAARLALLALEAELK